MAGDTRPLRTLTAIARLKERYPDLKRVRVGDVEIDFGNTEAAPVGELVSPRQAQPPIKPDLPIKEQPLSDADLVLDPPAGMLVPVTEQDSN